MTRKDPRPIDELRVRDDVAQRLLARAVELDAEGGLASVGQLRRAADEAGISPAAFEAALQELRLTEQRPPSPSRRSAPVRGHAGFARRRTTLLVGLAGLALGLLAGGGAMLRLQPVSLLPRVVRVRAVPVAPYTRERTRVVAPAFPASRHRVERR